VYLKIKYRHLPLERVRKIIEREVQIVAQDALANSRTKMREAIRQRQGKSWWELGDWRQIFETE
jgi:hypothetical protein